MATDKTTREATPPQPAEDDVAGHGLVKGFGAPETDQVAEVEGHGKRFRDPLETDQ